VWNAFVLILASFDPSGGYEDGVFVLRRLLLRGSIEDLASSCCKWNCHGFLTKIANTKGNISRYSKFKYKSETTWDMSKRY
jgi:hypothetical protein